MNLEDGNLEEYYQEILHDHFKKPRNKGTPQQYDLAAEVASITCGDRIQVTIVLDKKDRDIIQSVLFNGAGCSISQASASMLTEFVKGKSIGHVSDVVKIVKKMLTEGIETGCLEQLGDIAALSGVRQFAMRVKCALLAWEALEECLERK